MKKMWKEYLTFSRKERIGISVLLFVLVLFLLIPEIYKPELPAAIVDTSLVNLFAKQPTGEKVAFADLEKTDANKLDNIDARKFKLFMFDPNTLSESQWLDLGIQARTVKTILNYRNKGGKFRIALDIKKIWGITPADAQRLIPYIQIAPEFGNQYSINNYKVNKTVFSSSSNASQAKGMHPPGFQCKIVKIEINTATEHDWELLPGIGPVIAKRIVKFRDKLGGFKEMDQIKKTYGISDSLFDRLRPLLTMESSNEQPSKKESNSLNGAVLKRGLLNINKATVNHLIEVGISEDIAKAIVLYRQQHGAYKKVEDLRNIVFIHAVMFDSISGKLFVE